MSVLGTKKFANAVKCMSFLLCMLLASVVVVK